VGSRVLGEVPRDLVAGAAYHRPMRARFLLPVAPALLIFACGARTSLVSPPPEPARDAAPPFEPERDASVDVPFDAFPIDDAPEPDDASFDVTDAPVDEPDAPIDEPDASFDAPFDAGTCEEGQNTDFPPSECSGTTSLWLAGPYRSTRDIVVTRIEIHTTGGRVALLTSAAGAPGMPLFSGSVGPSAQPGWLGVNVNPPVQLHAGVLYWTAEEAGYCSQTQGGPEDIEYGSPSLDGPWMVTGTDNWTARFIGTCP
jgi:hypothetical protein